tara:strand:- start:170 stop:667 length:498 start_codon:yes stop_codon:yes gene_type:complete
MINAIRLIAPVILTSFMLVSANTKRDNHFLGKWEIDIQKTLSLNDFSGGSNQRLNIKSSDHVINFGLAGNYNERFGGLKFKGSWSRYDTDLAVARLESDDRIKNLKGHLNQKIKQGNKSRHELTRLYQRMHKVNRISVRIYTYKDGNVFLEQDGMDIVLVFRRAG